MMIKGRINWARGLFRIWLLLSLVWMGALTIAFRPDEALPGYYEAYERTYGYGLEVVSIPKDATGDEKLRRDKAIALMMASDRETTEYKDDLIRYAVIAIAPSMTLFVLGAGLLWAFRGFRHASHNS